MHSREGEIRIIADFAAQAEHYCAFIESLKTNKSGDLYLTLEELLAHLYTAILPVDKCCHPIEKEKYESLRLSSSERGSIQVAIAEAVRKESAELFELHGSDRDRLDFVGKFTATRAELLFDDLTDIYTDLKNGLRLWEQQTPETIAEATWNWRFFSKHIGVTICSELARRYTRYGIDWIRIESLVLQHSALQSEYPIAATCQVARLLVNRSTTRTLAACGY